MLNKTTITLILLLFTLGVHAESTKTFTYNQRDQLVLIEDTQNPDNTVVLAYDENGNRISKTQNGVLTEYKWSARGKLVEVSRNSMWFARYEYNYLGLRTSKSIRKVGRSTTKVFYTYDPMTNNLLFETNVLGNVIARYHWGNGLLLAENRSYKTYYYHYNGLNSPVAISNQDGSIRARIAYDAYGNIKGTQGSPTSPLGFTGYYADDETGLYYAQQRYYDAELGAFISEDTAPGNQNEPMSLHRYLYAYVNPNKYFDPDGQKPAQFEELMTTAVEKFITSGNRTALGDTGELVLEKLLRANGDIIIKGPVTNPGQHNADIITFDPEKSQLTFFDNKIQSLRANVSRVPNLSKESGKLKSIRDAQKLLENLNLDPKMEMKIKTALKAAASNPSHAIWAVANANAGDLTGVNNKVKRVSQRLVDNGVLFADVVGDEVILLSKIKSSNNGKKFSKKLLSTIPALGTILATVSTMERVEAANKEDRLFAQAMSDMGINDPLFAHQSLAREVSIIASEQAAGTGGFVAGAAAAAGPSAACGFGYPACVALGGLVGSFVGDTAGGASAGFIFDKATQPSHLQLEEIKRRVREQRRNADVKIVTEDPGKPGVL